MDFVAKQNQGIGG